MAYHCHWFSEQVGLASDLGLTNDVLIPLLRTWTGLCKEYGSVIDVYIPFKKSKANKESKFEYKDLDNVKGDSDVEKVLKTSGMQENEIGNDNEHSIHGEENLHSSDPFIIYELLQKKKDNIHQTNESDPTHPPGFTPKLGNNNKEEGSNSVNDQRKSVSGKKIFSYHNVGASTHHTTCMPITGGSILDVMDDLVKVGQTMGIGHKAKKGCFKELCLMHKINFVAIQETKMVSVDFFSIKMLWGNLAFDHAMSSFVDYFLVIMGPWTPTSTKLPVISVYAPQELSEKRELWGYLCSLIDRHLSDHRPIIMFESKLDYGPIPFRMFHSWFKMEGFDKFVEDTWNSMNVMDLNGLIRMKKKLQLLDRGEGDDEILEQVEELENFISYDEIKKAVWEYGINKSPGPNGFTFEFFQKYWKTMGQDIVAAVTEFFSTCKFPPGCNSTFIALIPKIHDAKTIKDFRPISLIGSIYKIIAKILANRLSLVISDLIYEVQIACGNHKGG
ncbi:hypothetical protein Tco_0461826 [Tanacetum coccineum]